MSAYNEALTLNEFIMFGFESDVVSGIMYFPSTIYEPLFLGPVSYVNH